MRKLFMFFIWIFLSQDITALNEALESENNTDKSADNKNTKKNNDDVVNSHHEEKKYTSKSNQVYYSLDNFIPTNYGIKNAITKNAAKHKKFTWTEIKAGDNGKLINKANVSYTDNFIPIELEQNACKPGKKTKKKFSIDSLFNEDAFNTPENREQKN